MKHKPLIISGIVLGILLIIYFGFAIFFNSHYLWHTTVGAVKCGGKSSDYVVELNTRNAQEYLLTIYDRNGNKFHLQGSDFSFEYVPKGEEESILKEQNPLTWPVSIFKSSTYELSASVSYDSTALETALKDLDIFSEDYIVEPVDAYINLTDTGYEVVDEVMGCSPIYDTILSYVVDAVNNQTTEISLTDDCYVAPEVYASDAKITDAAAQIDTYLNSTIHYDIDNADENLTKEDILAMISIDENGSVVIDTTAVDDFVQKLATTYNTYGDVRSFTTSKGDVVEVGGGDYGWVINKTEEAAEILKDLEQGSPVEREPVYEQTAMQSGTDDIGNTYVEIDYTNQHLWFYKEGTLIVETDIVSGNISKSNGSVDGIYKIVYKEKDATLVGEDYESSVKYFMPFAYNIGIHDASWRSQFGGTIYKTSGSHGCVNVPEEAAATIFENIEVGTPVVAYYRETVELTNNAAKVSNAYSYVDKEAEEEQEEETQE